MQTLGITVFHIIVTMIVLLAMSLLMGKRHVGELTLLDLIVSITIGTVAGAGIVDPSIDLVTVVISIVILGFAQYIISWVTIKDRKLQRKIMHEPTVLIENGVIIKANLQKVRLPLESVLGLLREKEIFDITEVELAILEPHGKLSVLKKAKFKPLNASQVNLAVPSNKILTPVIIEGELQTKNLEQMGFSASQIEEFGKQYQEILANVFVAFMDQDRKLYDFNQDAKEKGIFCH